MQVTLSPPSVTEYKPTEAGLNAFQAVNVATPQANPLHTAMQMADRFEQINWKPKEAKEYADKFFREWNELFFEFTHPQPNKQKITTEAGDVMISFFRLLKFLNVSPEDALLHASNKYALRMQTMMKQSNTHSLNELSSLPGESRSHLWKETKSLFP
jgi:tetrapyrrole methylase family protein/MazG family protein